MDTITLPTRVIEQVLQTSEDLILLHDELEDYLITHQPSLLKKLRKARREHLAGRTRPFALPLPTSR